MTAAATINLPMSPSEVPALRESVGWDRRDSDYPALLERCSFWAGVRDGAGHLVAFGYMVDIGLEHGYIEDVIVSPAHQRKGLGRAVVSALLEEAKRRGTAIVTLTFERRNLGFYEACGFKACLGGLWTAPKPGE